MEFTPLTLELISVTVLAFALVFIASLLGQMLKVAVEIIIDGWQ